MCVQMRRNVRVSKSEPLSIPSRSYRHTLADDGVIQIVYTDSKGLTFSSAQILDPVVYRTHSKPARPSPSSHRMDVHLIHFIVALNPDASSLLFETGNND